VNAISLPMPLAAPVTMADLSWSFMSDPLCGEIVVDDRAKPKGHVGQIVHAAEDLMHRQERRRRECRVKQLLPLPAASPNEEKPGALNSDCRGERPSS
jgi:hypothetical protein